MDRVARALRARKSWCLGAQLGAQGLGKLDRTLRHHRLQRQRIVCFRCSKVIPLDVWRTKVMGTDNALFLRFAGGYGEFHDSWDGDHELVLCHECGHALADWLGLDVHNWHTHSGGGGQPGGQHRDHHDHADAER